MGQTYDFRDGLFGLREGAETTRIDIGVDLFDELEGHEVEDEGLLVQDHDHHVLAQLDVHDELRGVEGNLCPVLLLVVVPDHHLVPLLLVNEHNHVRLIHHLYQRNLLPQILHLFLKSRAPRVVLQNLKASLGCNSEVLLCLVGCDGVHLRLLIFFSGGSGSPIILILDRLHMCLLVLLHDDLVNDAILCRHHVPLLINTLLHVRLVLLILLGLLVLRVVAAICCGLIFFVFHFL